MPKDAKKNRYFQVGVGWDSWTLEQLEADAKLHQMDDQPAKLIILRLTEYYKLVERGMIIPGVTAMMQPSQAQAAPALVNGHNNNNGAMPATNTKRGGSAAVTAPKEEQSNTVTESDAAADNADAAFDFFKMDDDE